MATKRAVTKRPAPVGGSLRGVPRPSDDYDMASSLGNGTDDDDGVAVALTANGGAVFVPQSLRRASPAQREVVRQLQLTVLRRQRLMDEVDALVAELRSSGVSWNSIGWSVGTTGEAARQRWGVDGHGPAS